VYGADVSEESKSTKQNESAVTLSPLKEIVEEKADYRISDKGD
jgi:hypothetical protein